MAVRGRKQGNTNTGFKGITQTKQGNFVARIVFNVRGNQTNTYLGSYKNLADAVHARSKFITELI